MYVGTYFPMATTSDKGYFKFEKIKNYERFQCTRKYHIICDRISFTCVVL